MGLTPNHPVSRRLFMQQSAALSALFAAWRTSPAFAQAAALNILNSNTLWAEALTDGIAKEYTGAAITGEGLCCTNRLRVGRPLSPGRPIL